MTWMAAMATKLLNNIFIMILKRYDACKQKFFIVRVFSLWILRLPDADTIDYKFPSHLYNCGVRADSYWIASKLDISNISCIKNEHIRLWFCERAWYHVRWVSEGVSIWMECTKPRHFGFCLHVNGVCNACICIWVWTRHAKRRSGQIPKKIATTK